VRRSRLEIMNSTQNNILRILKNLILIKGIRNGIGLFGNKVLPIESEVEIQEYLQSNSVGTDFENFEPICALPFMLKSETDFIFLETSWTEFISFHNMAVGEIYDKIGKGNLTLLFFAREVPHIFESEKMHLAQLRNLSARYGTMISQAKSMTNVFLFDKSYRFYGEDDSIRKFEMKGNSSPIIDRKHSELKYLSDERVFIKSLPDFEGQESAFREMISERNNWLKIGESESLREIYGQTEAEISFDSLGVHLSRRHYPGSILMDILEVESIDHLVKCVFRTALKFADSKLFPNDLRPWNIVYWQNYCIFIDFPYCVKMDRDVSDIPNLISLYCCLAFVKLAGKRDYFEILSETKHWLCADGRIYRKNAFDKFYNAWLELYKFENMFALDYSEENLRLLLDVVFENA
jgi:hypothetical protein